jgi:uroporphyrinogen decarboxylase
MTQTHRERVRAVLAGERPDRPVVDLGGRVASLSLPAYLDLKATLGLGAELTSETVTLLNTIGRLDERVLERFDVPLRRLYLRPPSTFELKITDGGSFHDEWGVGYRPRGPYNERVGHPLAGTRLEDLDRFPWPDSHDADRVAGLAEEARRLYEETDFSLSAGHISAGIFQDCWNLRGMERFFEDMARDREFAEELLDRVTAVHVGMWEHFLDAVGEYVDLVETADDLGGQTGLLISPRMYRALIKPRHAALNAGIRSRTRAKILYHSCGAIMRVIDDLVEIGVDVLNPIQPLPGLMDPEELKRRYGKRLIFHGGLDVQSLLPTGTPEQVRAHVRRYLDILGPERYIMAPANSVQPGTPPENLVTAYEAAGDYDMR